MTMSTSDEAMQPNRPVVTRRSRALLALGVLIAGNLVCASARAQQSETRGQAPSPQDDPAQNFMVQQEIGRRFHIDPADLPAPKIGSIVTNRSLKVPYDGQ